MFSSVLEKKTKQNSPCFCKISQHTFHWKVLRLQSTCVMIRMSWPLAVRLNFIRKHFHCLDLLPVFPTPRVHFSNIFLQLGFLQVLPSHKQSSALSCPSNLAFPLSFLLLHLSCKWLSFPCHHTNIPFKWNPTKLWLIPAACLAWSAAGTGAAGPWWGSLLFGKAVPFLVSAAPPHSCRHPAANGDCRSLLSEHRLEQPGLGNKHIWVQGSHSLLRLSGLLGEIGERESHPNS